MTRCAPLGPVVHQSRGVASGRDETIEEVRAGARHLAPLCGPRQDATETHPIDAVPAPVSAPPIARIARAALALLRPTRAFSRTNHRLIRRGQRAVLRELVGGAL